jgi:hypothetical protein
MEIQQTSFKITILFRYSTYRNYLLDICASTSLVIDHKLMGSDRNYTAMRTHVWRSVHLSALLITWYTWGDGLQRRYASDVTFLHHSFPSHSW